MVAAGFVFLIEYLDDTIKDPISVAQITDLSTIGLIAESPLQRENEPLIMMAQPRSPNAEAYRQLRTNVQYIGVSRPLSTILVTSPNAAEGKSTTAANLAIALAQADNRVLLVDGDMRRPFLHRKFGMSNDVGLTNLLLSREDDAAFVQETAVPNLRLITSGPLPPNPAELIHSERMKHLIEWLGETADYIVVDSPPVLAVTDSVLLSQLASTTLMVVEANKTRQQSLLLALQQIEAVGGHLAGILINKINPRRSGYYYNYYSYYTDDQTHASNTPRPKRKSKLGEGLSSLLML
jgi:capsular exopolysaccharide synthesis family protein